MVRLAVELLAERYGVTGTPRTIAESARRSGLSRVHVRVIEGPLVATLRRLDPDTLDALRRAAG